MKHLRIFTVTIMLIISIFVFTGNTFAEEGRVPLGNEIFTGMTLTEVKEIVNMRGQKLKVYNRGNNLVLIQKINTDILFVFGSCTGKLLAKIYIGETSKADKFKKDFKKNEEVKSMKSGNTEFLRVGDAGYKFMPYNEEGTATFIWMASISRWNNFVQYCSQSSSNQPFPLF